MVDLIRAKIEWTITDPIQGVQGRKAQGECMGFRIEVDWNDRGGWNIKLNGVQAWTHMRSFNEALDSVRQRISGWAYIDQFRNKGE